MAAMKTDDCVFRYQPQWVGLLAGIGVCGICGYWAGVHAAANDRGLIINGLIELSRENATTFWWVIAWIFWGFIPVAAVLVICRFVNPQQLVLTGEGLYAGKWPWSPPALIRYGNISKVFSYTIRGRPFLKIVHSAGKQTVVAACLESTEAFEEFCDKLGQRLRTTHGAGAENVGRSAAPATW